MSWNYRVVKKKFGEEEAYQVCEVYYDKNEKPISYAEGKNVLSQDSLKDLKWSYGEIAKALQRPVLFDTGKQLIELENERLDKNEEV